MKHTKRHLFPANGRRLTAILLALLLLLSGAVSSLAEYDPLVGEPEGMELEEPGDYDPEKDPANYETEDDPESEEPELEAAAPENLNTEEMEAAADGEGSPTNEEQTRPMAIENQGFLVPLPTGEGWQGGVIHGTMGLFGSCAHTDENGVVRTIQYIHRRLDEFAIEDSVINHYSDQINLENEQNVQMENWLIEGHPARLVTFSYFLEDGTFGAYAGLILYAREMQLLQVRVYSEWPGHTRARVPKVTMDDLKELTEQIHYDPEKAPIRHADVELTLTAENDATAVAAGKTLQFTAAFGNAEIVSAKKQNNGITWQVLDAATNQPTTQATISQSGLLTVNADVTSLMDLDIWAVSDTWNTSAAARVTVVQPAEQITVAPEELTFWAGSEESAALTATLTPLTWPIIGLRWSASKDGVVEIQDHGDGTAAVLPLAAGKATVRVQEAGGKKAEMKVTVRQPVTEVQVTTKGKPKPGASVQMSAKVLPEEAEDKRVVWAIDVDDTIAEITPRGKLKIRKATPVGTVIHVTCTANWGPQPVTGSLDLLVSE